MKPTGPLPAAVRSSLISVITDAKIGDDRPASQLSTNLRNHEGKVELELTGAEKSHLRLVKIDQQESPIGRDIWIPAASSVVDTTILADVRAVLVRDVVRQSVVAGEVLRDSLLLVRWWCVVVGEPSGYIRH